MKKLLGILVLGLLLCNNSFAAKKGKGEVKLSDAVVHHFKDYLSGKIVKGTRWKPSVFILSSNGVQSVYYYCPYDGGCSGRGIEEDIRNCERETNVHCGVFSRKRTVIWDNGNNFPTKEKRFNSKWDLVKIKSQLEKLGFYDGGKTTKTETKITKKTKKVEKKKEEKVVKKYSIEGERSLALSWDGYSDLIAGTVKFSEADYKGTLNLTLPNNDGTCEGSYSLQADSKGTWQISCTNNMGAAGTLKWTKDGGVTGIGIDHKDKKVKFTVSKQS